MDLHGKPEQRHASDPAEASVSRGDVRPFARVYAGVPTRDGAGVQLTRMVGTSSLPDIDPFLMLDQIRSDSREDWIAGFPNHPHRGFETVTLMLAGRMRHGDNQGHSGVIEAGGVQWMTAGRGIVHSEIPEQQDGLLWGLQLWLNLPASAKMTPPRYQEFSADQIPVEQRSGAVVRVIAGTTCSGITGPARSAATDPLLLDVRLAPGARLEEQIPSGHSAFVAVYAGGILGHDAAGAALEVHDPNLAVLGDGAAVVVQAGGEGARFLLAAARPLREPVVRHGPFVMNTESEIRQAVADFRAGRL
jgi:quercetin 2,3-dioxygenase